MAHLTAPLIGRTAELSLLDEALRASADGEPGLVLLGGEAGVGKSRLVGEFCRLTRDSGGTVLRGGCLDLGSGALPFLPLTEGLRALVRERGPASVRALAGPGWPELARLLPALATGVADDGAPREGSTVQLLDAVLRLLDECAQQAPTVLVVEDVHWIDRSTLDLLLFLARTLTDQRVLVVVSYRSGPSPQLRSTLAELVATGRCRRHELAPLAAADMYELVAALLGGSPDRQLVDAIVGRAEGNPFFARELAAAGAPVDGQIPLGVRDLILARLDAVGPAARQVASIVATAGRPAAHPLVAAACSLPRDQLLLALRECVAAQLLVVDDSGCYTFPHALTRDAVYAELLPGELAGCHGCLAEALAAQPRLGLGEAAGATAELAHHWDRAGDLPRALSASAAAGAAAAAVFGYAEAERQYERALRLWAAVDELPPDLPEHAELLATAADACRWAGHTERALELVDAAVAALGPRPTPERAGSLLERRGRYLWEGGQVEASLRAYEQATAAFDGAPPGPEQAWVLAGHATALVQAGRLRAGLTRAREALHVADETRAEAAVGRALNTLGAASTLLGSPEEGITALREAVRLAEAGRHPEEIIRGYANLGYALESAGRLSESLAVVQQGVRRARELGLATGGGGGILLANTASVLAMLGRWDEAEEVADGIDAGTAPRWFEGYRQIVQAEIDVGRGRFAEATARVGAGVAGSARLDEPQFAGLLYAIRAEAAVWQGDDRAALDAVERGLAAVAATDDPGQVLRLCALGLRAAVDAAPRAPRPAGDTTQHLLDRAHRAWQEVPTLPALAASWEQCRAEQARAVDDDPDTWAAVAQRWEAQERPYPEAYARWRQGEAALRRRDRRAAVPPLATARALGRQLGAAPLLAEIETLTRASRLTLPHNETSDAAPAGNRYGITPREVEVLELLRDGLSNRQIARRLFIAEKTVAAHVSNILGKLVVPNRSQAVLAAHRARLLR